jgi:hypothetical protein
MRNLSYPWKAGSPTLLFLGFHLLNHVMIMWVRVRVRVGVRVGVGVRVTNAPRHLYTCLYAG